MTFQYNHLIKKMALCGLAFCGLGFSPLLAGGAASAKPLAYDFNKTHTQISASWNHWGYSRQQIEFTDFEGQLLLDFDNPSESSVDITIKLGGMAYWVGAPSSDRFEKHLASAGMFNIEAFPTAHFVATSFESEDNVTGVMHGDLTIKGLTHPVSLDVTLNKKGLVRGRHWAGFSARGVIARSQWGLGFGMPDVSDDVIIMIETELAGPEAE